MAVTVSLPLFGEPARELSEGSAITGRQLRELAIGLHDRLDKAAATLETLAEAGWSAHVALFDAILHHPNIDTREAAERLLREKGVDPEALIIVEDVDDDEDKIEPITMQPLRRQVEGPRAVPPSVRRAYVNCVLPMSATGGTDSDIFQSSFAGISSSCEFIAWSQVTSLPV
jgi:hypothetical protein